MSIVTASAATIENAGALIRAGDLVAFPTETVYGLGADATQGRAVAQIFAIKGRPSFNPLIVHVPDVQAASEIAEMSPSAIRLAEAFWPGPLSLVLGRRPNSGISDLVTAGLDTIAIRVPQNAVAQALLLAARRPIAAPSANRSGRVSPTTAAHVAEDLDGAIAMILDGGACTHGLESTVLDASGADIRLLRPGAIPREEIERVLGTRLRAPDAVNVRNPASPGQLESHYAPRASVRLNASNVTDGEALLALGNAPATQGPVINLSPTGDLVEAAAGLFAALRALDAYGVNTIAVMPIPEEGLGEAINDRLRRAAAPRS